MTLCQKKILQYQYAPLRGVYKPDPKAFLIGQVKGVTQHHLVKNGGLLQCRFSLSLLSAWAQIKPRTWFSNIFSKTWIQIILDHLFQLNDFLKREELSHCSVLCVALFLISSTPDNSTWKWWCSSWSSQLCCSQLWGPWSVFFRNRGWLLLSVEPLIFPGGGNLAGRFLNSGSFFSQFIWLCNFDFGMVELHVH